MRGNNWRIIKYLKNHGLETEDKFEDMVVFWNNNQSKYYHTRDENNKVVFTQVKDEYKEELDYYDYLDYMNENDAICSHLGQSPQAESDIKIFKMDDINGQNYE